MKNIVQNEKLGEIQYEESFWTGHKSLKINGTALEKISKKEFKTESGSTATVKGGFLQGATLEIEGESVRIMPKIKWYEIVLCVLPFLLIMIWGNSVQLCQIVPVVGGAIGGGLSGLFSVAGLVGMRCAKPVWFKIIIAVAAVAVTFGVCCGIGYAILASM